MQLSSYQEKIIDWVKKGVGHGCCNAVAGSGKSTTLRLAAIALKEAGIKPSEIKVCVFGKANSLDLIAKFGQEWKESISTLHSAGWSLVKKHLSIRNNYEVKVSGNKYKEIAEELGLIGKPGKYGSLQLEDALEKNEDFIKLIELVRLTNSEPIAETVEEICDHFEMADIYEFSIVADAIAQCLNIGENQARKKTGFDFTDQIWLPVKWKLNQHRWFKPYKFVLVDECQDLNAAQLELAIALAGNDGRLLFVGDPRQAIMGFAGADCNSYQNILERTKSIELSLSICYRCPSSHIELVKKNFPEIPMIPRANAIEGKIEAIAEADLWSEKPCRLTTGDMVICRKTAPLVKLCIRLITRGIAATVKGRAIGELIKGDLKEIAKMPGFRYSNFNGAVSAYKAAKQQRYEGLENEEQLLEALNDKLEALTAIYKSQPQATCIAHLENYIDSLFSDEISPITLSTCHRAKGLEGDRIFIISPNDLPMVWRNQQGWQLEQENNLLYVALTRSKSELYVVGNASWLNPKLEPEPETKEETVSPLQQPNSKEKLKNWIEGLHDKVRAALLSPEWQSKSDRAIADFCGVSTPTVTKQRLQLQEEGLLPEITERIDKSGRKLNTGNIGTRVNHREKILQIASEMDRDEIEEIIKLLKAML
ncbi:MULTISPECIES: UvrD-helicase domain-containing protein [unclassified Microcoleus]|uniref:UvrD-helicase domain-containing protein n=1 Tax=unclassified Microcoleus TaxID=2642155 RepID=UPI002FD718AA